MNQIMDVKEFIEKFNDIIPYSFKVEVGGEKKDFIISGKAEKNDNNFKGKVYPFYKKDVGTKYVPTETVPLSIDIKVTCADAEKIVFDGENYGEYETNPTIKTGKDNIEKIIRIINKNGKQIGCIIISFNASGDIKSKTCFYENSLGTHKIYNSVDYHLEDGKLVREERTRYIEEKDNTKTTLSIMKMNGKVTGTSILVENIEEQIDPKLISITDIPNNSKKSNVEYFLSKCIFDSYEDALKNRRLPVPIESSCINDDLLSYKRNKALCERLIEEGRKDILRTLINRVKDSVNDYRDYMLDSKDLLSGFKGNYVGHIFIREKGRLTLLIKTKSDDLYYYTEIDLSDTDPFIGTYAFDILEEYGRDIEYFKRIKRSIRIPKYVTKVINGKERLIEGTTDITEKDFEFNFVDPLENLEEIKLGKVLSRKNNKKETK